MTMRYQKYVIILQVDVYCWQVANVDEFGITFINKLSSALHFNSLIAMKTRVNKITCLLSVPETGR